MTQSGTTPPSGFGVTTATAVVIANMVGSGVLTSIAFQVGSIHSTFALLALWVAGGVIALSGAICYTELSHAFEGSGGEFNYLTRTIHPALGFAAGWVSVLIGFAAPSAASAKALAQGVFPQSSATASSGMGPLRDLLVAAVFATVIALVHATHRRASALLQQSSTALKIVTVLALIIGGLAMSGGQPMHLTPDRAAWGELVTPAFATACYFVSYSYSGWNAAAYIAGEVKHAKRAVGWSILAGTAFVTLLYVLMNAAFLHALPRKDIDGNLDVAVRLGRSVFGLGGGEVVRVAIALMFVSGISSMILAGSRVTAALAATVPGLRWLAVTNTHGVPVRAVLLQLALVVAYVSSGTFEQLILLSGFILSLFTVFTVLGLVRARLTTDAEITRNPLLWLPVTLFLAFNGLVLVYGVKLHPYASGAGVAVAVSGVGVWWWTRRSAAARTPH